MKIKVQDKSEGDILKINFLGKELELAHDDYEKRKDEIITKLYTIWKCQDIPMIYRKWVQQAAIFIHESDMK